VAERGGGTGTTFVRDARIADKLVFVDGVSGSGKSILGLILASFDRVERYRLDCVYEHIAVLHKFGKITDDAATVLIRMHLDEALYHSMISREVNFRPFDHTGFLNNPFRLRSIARLFMKDGGAAVERIHRIKPILQVNCHQMFPAIRLAFLAFGERLRAVEMVLQPLFVVEHWVQFGMERYGADRRDLTLWIKSPGGETVPWFAHGWEEEFLLLPPVDRAIRTVHWLSQERDTVMAQASAEERRQVCIIPFERFVTDPWPFLHSLEEFLGAKTTATSRSVLKRQRCPREILTAGRGHKRSGWKKPDPSATNQAEIQRVRETIEGKASAKAVALLREMSVDYERQFPFDLARRRRSQ